MKTDLAENGLFRIVINRPERRNAVNFEVMSGLKDALETAEKERVIKAVLIRGAGDAAFCSGGDLKEFHSLETEAEAYEMLSKMGSIVLRLLTLKKPTIAFMNGAAVGGGCEIAAACDIRVAVPGIKLGFVQGNQGITTGWGGASILYEKLPASACLRLLLSGQVFTAAAARDLGFIDYILDSGESGEWKDYLDALLNKESGVLSGYKKLLISKWEEGNLHGRIHEEIAECSRLWVSEPHMEAVRRFTGKKNN
ncbi:enoyl-CoA hydratase/isomerase family protein [Peribacillus sp. SCS-37]|uniref:enoyl-CoA hydratase/isomerase family protein n=1 Tax=Paraperibacillus esterisolvens TaxID=3115296 RepID=UPI003905CFA5